jgi:putative toxin-antitoxin system antitoxin component (TIGR02293 family)
MSNTAAARRIESPLYRHIVADARQALTVNEIAAVTGVQPRSVQNWAAGATTPDGEQRNRLLELQYVIDQLSDVYDNEGIEIWLHRPQRMLGHRKPIDALRDGHFEDVLAVVNYLAGGPKQG